MFHCWVIVESKVFNNGDSLSVYKRIFWGLPLTISWFLIWCQGDLIEVHGSKKVSVAIVWCYSLYSVRLTWLKGNSYNQFKLREIIHRCGGAWEPSNCCGGYSRSRLRFFIETSGSLPAPRSGHVTTLIESFAHLLTKICHYQYVKSSSQLLIPMSKERFAIEYSHVGFRVSEEIHTISSNWEKYIIVYEYYIKKKA